MVEVSSLKEKVIVLTGTVAAAFTGYLTAIGRPLEAGLLGTISAAVIVFWSEGVNTETSK